ncbi:hypothetical protein M3Y97_00700800 [Aphelenchoides bicaudatus]|nr:hypothetical protein M3Y97_00700800 [Aphelenchoides bicaudatus]
MRSSSLIFLSIFAFLFMALAVNGYSISKQHNGNNAHQMASMRQERAAKSAEANLTKEEANSKEKQVAEGEEKEGEEAEEKVVAKRQEFSKQEFVRQERSVPQEFVRQERSVPQEFVRHPSGIFKARVCSTRKECSSRVRRQEFVPQEFARQERSPTGKTEDEEEKEKEEEAENEEPEADEEAKEEKSVEKTVKKTDKPEKERRKRQEFGDSNEVKKERRHTNSHRFHANSNNAASGPPTNQGTTEGYFE